MIFSFSGTGNSYHVAQRLCVALDTDYVDMAPAERYGRYEYDAKGEPVGFVFPVYYMGLPDMVRRFVSSVKVKNPGKTFCVTTCGGESGVACEILSEILEGRLTIDSYHDIVMPDNAIFAPYEMASPEDNVKLLEGTDASIDAIAGRIADGITGDFRTCAGQEGSRDLYKLYDEHRVTENFHLNDRCVECRICEEVCPEQIIKVYHRKPVWDEEKCTMCMCCLNLCPKTAIEYGEHTTGRARYNHPDFHMRKLGGQPTDYISG